MTEGDKDIGPIWWRDWVDDALNFVVRDPAIGETILSIGKLVEEGKNEEAREYASSARLKIESLIQNPKLDVKSGPDQLITMLASDKFPNYLKDKIYQRIPELKNYLPKVATTLSKVTT